MKLNKIQTEILLSALKSGVHTVSNKLGNNAGQNTSKEHVHKNFSVYNYFTGKSEFIKDTKGYILHSDIKVGDKRNQEVYRAIRDIDLPEPALQQPSGLSMLRTTRMSLVNRMKDEPERFIEKQKLEQMTQTSLASFASVCNVWVGDEVGEIKLTNGYFIIENGEAVSIKLCYTTKTAEFCLDLPLILKGGFFKKRGSLYSFNYCTKNIADYLDGKSDILILEHPYERMIKEIITLDSGERIKPDMFKNIVKSRATALREMPQYFQRKLNSFLSNVENGYGDDKKATPIVFVPQGLSEEAMKLRSQQIFIDMLTSDLAKYKLFPGLDLLSGSTSRPAVRCCLAINYEIKMNERGMTYMEKVRNEEYGDYISETKRDSVFFMKGSAKRDNTTTLKDTYPLAKGVGVLSSRVKIKIG